MKKGSYLIADALFVARGFCPLFGDTRYTSRVII